MSLVSGSDVIQQATFDGVVEDLFLSLTFIRSIVVIIFTYRRALTKDVINRLGESISGLEE